MTNPEPFLRAAEMADIPVLIELRLAMFQSMGCCDPNILAEVAAASETYMNAHLADGRFRAWLVEVDGQIAATGGLILREAPPAYHNLSGREGYIMGIYTRPEFRHRGLATAIMKRILVLLQEEGIPRATLRASQEGRLLYEKMGFEQTSEMKLELEDFDPEKPG
ncbi:N-acetylglutamate synthase [Longilinea arvoryzae]|uniref:N-acetylglutamate synthase n=1 Tax=Longilinea arvoryzae TaxID=360412 RepID=A0A0S7B5Y3_9CHLR|nr:GNAT family N-acetyltransferase [Longilinea arvoryzae]GAP12572.1 N-acetylglutamate synthase [Longilinea arvoryzae]